MISQELPPVGLRERKKAEVRQALQDATLRLAIEHGYENVTVDAIADAVDVSPRTFSNYFSSKEEALFAPNAYISEQLTAAIAARPADEAPLTVLAAVLVDMADHLVARRDAWQARMRLVAENPQLRPRMAAQFSRFEVILAQGVALRSGRDPTADPYPGLVAAAAAGALRVALAHWRPGAAQSLHELLTELFANLAAGLPDVPHTTAATERSSESHPS